MCIKRSFLKGEFFMRNPFCIKIVFVLALLMLFSFGFAQTESDKPTPKIFSTWNGFMEPDRCASAWAIKKFAEKDAVFKIYPVQTTAMDGVSFDVPLPGIYARQRNKTIMEAILSHHKVEDAAAWRVASIIRDIELNRWDSRATPEAAGVEAVINGLNKISRDEMDCLEKSMLIFDALYASFQKEEKPVSAEKSKR